MTKPTAFYTTRLFYKFTFLFLLMAGLVAATGLFGLRKVTTVTQRLQYLTQTHAAQGKLAVLMKASVHHAYGHLLEALLYADDLDQFEAIYVDYDLERGWFTTYIKRLLHGNDKLHLERPRPGSQLEERILRIQAIWPDFEKAAEAMRASELARFGAQGPQAPQGPSVTAQRRALDKELDSAIGRLLTAIDDLLVTVSIEQEKVKKGIAGTQRDAELALLTTVLTAIVLAIALGILVSRGMIVGLALIRERLMAIAQGERDASKLLTIHSHDEINDVAQGINDMLRQLVEREERIEQYSRDLAGQVAHRTAELSRANDQLGQELAERRRIEADLIVARQAAEDASRLKSEFLANMSHEIRTPMNAILGFSELLEGHVTEARYKDYLDGIRLGGKNLLKLINDILDLSKIEAGKLDIHPEAVNPARLCREIVQIFSVSATKKGLYLNLVINPCLPDILILDETRLRQVLLNLVGNAMKFTHQGGITITVAAEGEEHDLTSHIDLVIQVKDSGIGIPPEQIDLVFEAFRQQEGQNTRKYGGTGLGLTISKRLVEMMGGMIAVDSRPQAGSTFRIRLPQVQVAAMAEGTEEGTSSDADQIVFRGQTILMAEDIESNRQVVHGFLESRRLAVIDAANGQEAVAMAKAQRPDLILMDIQMPVMDGYTALRQLREEQATRAIPAVALTASVIRQDADTIRAAFDGYLRKPVSRQELILTLSQFLAHDQEEVRPPAATAASPEPSASYRSGLRLPATAARELSTTMRERWQAIRQLMMNDEVEEFGQALERLASDYGNAPLAAYGRDLAALAASFQLERMAALFDYYDELLTKIEID